MLKLIWLTMPGGWRRLPATFRPEISFHGKVTRALPDQLRAVDKRRLKEYQGSVAGTSFFYALQEALRELFAL
ncbi:hypothetical protein [Moorella sp. ACPs]|uniref:hypothetical protein n=1 Tax=Neomoorella carbonis TaxID=3062783 RepID=UPI0038735FC7